MTTSFAPRLVLLSGVLLAFLLLSSASLSTAEPLYPASSLSVSSPGYSALAGCSIQADWTASYPGRSSRDLYTVLPAPYCQFVSSIQTSNFTIYALDVRTGKLAWQWTCDPTRGDCDTELDKEGAVVRSATTPGRVYVAASRTTPAGQCDTLYALDAGTGKVLYNDTVCGAASSGNYAQPAVLVFPLTSLAGKDEYVLHMLSATKQGEDAPVHVLAGSDGRVVWSGSFTQVSWLNRQPLNHGREGLFTLYDTPSGESVYQVSANGSVALVSEQPPAFAKHNVYALRLRDAQPAILYENQGPDAYVAAFDVLTGAALWNSSDPFLVGDKWGTNATFRHLNGDWASPASTPGLFLVVNTATSTSGGSVVDVTQLALYNLSTGARYSASPLFTLTNLTHATDNPTTWDFVDDDVLAVRADSQWYMLDLPALTLRAHGHYAEYNQGFVSNEWLVAEDGSYVAVPYDGSKGLVQGFAPRPDALSADTFLASPNSLPRAAAPAAVLSSTTVALLTFAAVVLVAALMLAAAMLWSSRSVAAAKPTNQERLLTGDAQIA